MDDKYRKEYLDVLNEMRERDVEYFTTSDCHEYEDDNGDWHDGGMMDVTIKCDVNHVYNSMQVSTLGSLLGVTTYTLTLSRRVLFAGEIEVSMDSDKCDEIDQEIEQWFDGCNPNKGY